MKRIIVSLLISLSATLTAKCCCHPEDYSFYIKAGTGVSFSESANVSAPSSTWNPAIQGYNSSLGNRAIGELALGIEFCKFMDLEVGISNRSTFKYRKFQTPVGGGDSYTREFDLDVTSTLFSVGFLGRDIECLNWDFACGTVYPVLGFGLGVSNLKITNFRTTGLPPTGDSAPYNSFSAENEHTLRQNFTYTIFLGFEYNYNECWAVSTGYRWFDAGKFKGPRYQRVANGSAVDVEGQEWKMRFRANEWFIQLKIFL